MVARSSKSLAALTSRAPRQAHSFLIDATLCKGTHSVFELAIAGFSV